MKRVIITFLCLLCIVQAYSQSFTISGTIIDGESNEPLIGAGILVKGAGRYNPQIQISAESETKRSIFREKDKTKRSKKESAQHSKSRNKSFVMTSVSAL